MKPTALLLNVFVSMVAFTQFYRQGHFRWSIFLPLAIISIPMAWWGGGWSLTDDSYKKALGVFLLLSIVLIGWRRELGPKQLKPVFWPISLLLGASIGFLSGLLGIGGGIILSPILLLLRWTTQQQTAAISAAFIFVNSLAGLVGQLQKGVQLDTTMYICIPVALFGGGIGAYIGAKRLQREQLKYVLVVVLLIAVYKLFR